MPEVELWREYRSRHGFEIDRIVWAIALSGAAICRTWGGRVKAKDLIPRFWRPESLSNKELIARLSALPGAKVQRIPKGESLDGSR